MPLALGLLDKGYDVTVATNRKPDEVRAGQVMSSQCIFDPALRIERDLGIDEWGDACPPVQGIGFAVPHPEQAGAKAIDWAAPLDRPAQAVDQRLKMPVWLERFAARGNLLIQDVGVAELETLAQSHDLVILAAGKGEVVKLFERDAARSQFDKPQRALALTYVHGLAPTPDYSRVSFNLVPGVGEYFVFPALTLSGPCDIMVFEGVPGGPLDCWRDLKSPAEHLAASKRFLDTYLPWEGARAAKVELTDAKGILAGAFAPTIRKPVMTLPSGKLVFGLGDAVVVNDPVTGQGSNNATKAAKVYLDAILARRRALHARMDGTDLRALLGLCQVGGAMDQLAAAAAPPHILQVLGAAQQSPAGRPHRQRLQSSAQLLPWWSDAAEAGELLKRHQAVARPPDRPCMRNPA